MPFAALLALIPLKDWLYAAVIAALLAAGAWEYHRIREAGWDAALEQVKRQDTKASDAAAAAQRTADACYSANGTWNVLTGRCLP